jgi:MFS family permease
MENNSKKPLLKHITPAVWALSLISLFTDMASEMLYPIMPIYLKTIGFSVVLIGILEGIAEATAGLSKGYFGKLSDASGSRKPFVQIGYTLSALSKPLMAVSIYPLWIFFVRTLDRLGKGVRTGARDALLSAQATPQTKGRIFGFHRSMDTLGAVIGPTLACVYLYFYPQQYRTLFIVALIPGILAIGATLLLKETATPAKPALANVSFFSTFHYWKQSPPAYRKLLIGLLLFALFNSSDVFLLLKTKQAGLDDTTVIAIYIFYNLVYALSAFPIGILADKVGLKTIFLIGLGLFAMVYLGISFNTHLYGFVGLFFLYGVYASATEGIAKAWISNITNTQHTATAIGTFSGLQSICALVASSLTGLLWFWFGASTALITTAIATLGVIVYLLAASIPTRQIT